MAIATESLDDVHPQPEASGEFVLFEGRQIAVEAAGCPLCGESRLGPKAYGRGPFTVRPCGGCGLWYMMPRPTPAALASFYASEDYFGGGNIGYADYRSQEQALRLTFRKLLTQLSRRGVTGGSLLEVGAGLGYLLDEARPYFGERSGVELSAAAATVASETAGAPVVTALEHLAPAATFDCIVATHVVEHVPEPVAFARSLAARLSPGGVLVLAAPDMASPLRHVMGNRWPSFKYPEHLSYFDRTTLPKVLDRAGLMAIEEIGYPHVFPLGLILSKFGIRAPRPIGAITITLPTTTTCFMGRKGPPAS